MNKLALGLAAAAALYPLTGCKGNSEKPAGATAGAVKIGLVTDVGGRGDQSFNDGALRGVEMWAAGKKYTAGGYQPLADAEREGSVPPSLKEAGIAPLSVTPV